MIRFINLTGQILIDDPEPHFAWFDTITDEFMVFAGTQEWHTWNDFVDDLTIELRVKLTFPIEAAKVLLRYRKLFQFKTSQTILLILLQGLTLFL